jgi:hypothetical protein
MFNYRLLGDKREAESIFEKGQDKLLMVYLLRTDLRICYFCLFCDMQLKVELVFYFIKDLDSQLNGPIAYDLRNYL